MFPARDAPQSAVSRLALGRKIGQTIVIDERIEVTVVRIDERGVVRLSIAAPREVPIRRKELPKQKAGRKKTTAGKLADGRRRVVISD